MAFVNFSSRIILVNAVSHVNAYSGFLACALLVFFCDQRSLCYGLC